METIKYQEILGTLEQFDEWLRKMGIIPKSDRIHGAIEIVRKAQEGFERAREIGDPTKIGDVNTYYFGIVEALEFYDIFHAFVNDDPPVLRPKLEVALSGPLNPADERPETAHGRNTMFELSLAAEWRLRGLRCSVGDPDIVLDLNPTSFAIECKRPFKAESIRVNIKGAADQLAEKVGSGVNERSGAIAVSASRIFNRGNMLFVTPNEAGKERLGDRLQQLAQENEHQWRRRDYDRRIKGVLFHVATPGVVRDTDVLVRMSYLIVTPLGEGGQEFELLSNTLRQAYREP